jgi:hypothetical protein
VLNLNFNLNFKLNSIMNRDSSVGIATRQRPGRPKNRRSIAGRCKSFSLLHNVQTHSAPNQTLIYLFIFFFL